jgi:ubiquinone/menaquinone biosynthesis C-methylase UbiE
MAGPGEVGALQPDYRRPMESRSRSLLAAAALARIDEMGGRMATRETSAAELDERKAAVRAMWTLGDYHRFALETVWPLGPVLVEACGIGPGRRVLDVAAGTGNVAIRAAEAGATVVASDLTPAQFEAGRREARARGLTLEWVEADAEALPFADGEFDVVTSAFGAMFAPDHRAVADELLRVCRPGGTIGMLNFTPEGLGARFFALFERFGPPSPADTPSPVLWGSEEHVRELFGNRVEALELSRHEYSERAATPLDYLALLQETFGPVIALQAFLADQSERAAALERESLAFVTEENRGAPDGPAEYRYEYLLVVARKGGA